MADLSYGDLSAFTPDQQRIVRRIIDSHNNIAQQGNLSPVGTTPPPPPHAQLTVTGGAGFFRADISDPSPSFRGKEHFLEVSEDKNFSNPHVIHLGASQSYYGPLGEKKLHFRSYAQYATSAPSQPVYRMDVNGVGGSAPVVGSQQKGLQGYGTAPYTTPTVPKRA